MADTLENLIRSELESSQQTQQGQTGQATPAGSPIRVNIGGQEYVFNSQEELSTALTRTLEAYNAKMAELAKAAEQAKQAAPQESRGSYVEEDRPKPFSQERYIELLRTDPIQAQEYLDSYRYFNGEVEKPSQLITAALARVAQQDRIIAAYQFRDNHPEFPGGDQAADLLEQVRRENNLPFTLAGLEAALGIAQSRGLLPTRDQYLAFIQQQQAAMQQAYSQGGQVQQNQRPMGPPMVGRGAAEVSPDLASMAESLTPEQIEKILEKVQGQTR